MEEMDAAIGETEENADGYTECLLGPNPGYAKYGPVAGIYFKGLIYIFYRWIDHAYWLLWRDEIGFDKYELKGSSIEFKAPQVVLGRFYIADKGHCYGRFLASCVHNNSLYMFYQLFDHTSEPVIKYFSSVDGEHWIDHYLDFSDSTKSGFVNESQFSVVSVGERMYLFASEPGSHKLFIASTKDGIKWDKWNSSEWDIWDIPDVRHVSACDYLDANGRPHVMLGVVATSGRVYTAQFRHEPLSTSDSGLVLIGTKNHDDLDNRDFIALIAGSTEGGKSGNIVQMFINGKHAPEDLQVWSQSLKKEFEVMTGQWGRSYPMTKGIGQKATWAGMNAFKCYVKTANGDIYQQIWKVMNYTSGWWETVGEVCITRWNSDKLLFYETKKNYVYDNLKALIGVVEGPPPYILNGKTPAEAALKPASKFTYGLSNTTRVLTNITMKGKILIKYGTPLSKITGAKFGFSYELGSKIGEKKETISHTLFMLYPDAVKNNVLYIYLRPCIERTEYRLKDWKGVDIPNCSAYIFNPTDTVALDFETREILDRYPGHPRTNDITSWYKRPIDVSRIADPKTLINAPISWVSPGESSFILTQRCESIGTATSTVEAFVESKIQDIFNINASFSFSYEISHSTEISESIGFTLSYPSARPGMPDDFSKVELTCLIMSPLEAEASNGNCYWIPADKKGQRPWCVAWNVDNYKMQEVATCCMDNWNQPEYYETIQFDDIDGDGLPELIGRSSSGIEAWNYNPETQKWSKLLNGPPLSDVQGWDQPQYYETLQLADIDGDSKAELIGRSPSGIVVWKYEPQALKWNRLPDMPEVSDNLGWAQPQYYKTLQLADIDGDGKAELIGRGPSGIVAWKYEPDPLAPRWINLPNGPALSNAQGWSNPQFYETIQLADIDGDGKAELIARNSSLIRVWRYDPFNGSWINLPNGPAWGDAQGWDQPQYYKTIQLADIDGDGKAELIGRGPSGIVVWKYDPNPQPPRWIKLSNGPALSDAQGWSNPQFYETIQFADIDNDGQAELIARNSSLIRVWRYDPVSDSWINLPNGPALSDAQGWAQPQYYKTLQLADIDGDGNAELIGRSPSGIVVWDV